SWLTTTDHKKIGIMYVGFGFLFFAIAGILALLIRIQLAFPHHLGEHLPFTEPAYNQLLSMHGTLMIFWFLIPALVGVGNYFVPLMIGARDMAFPRVNA